MANYNLKFGRRNTAMSIIDMINKYHTDYDNIKNEGSSLLSSFASSSGEDYDLRKDTLECAEIINNATSEITKIDSRYSYDWYNTAIEWSTINNINLLSYVPPIINEVKDTSGNIYPSWQRDISKVHSLFRRYNSWTVRTNLMNPTDIFDDDYVIQRTIVDLDKDYKWKWGNKDAVKEVNIKTYESDIDPVIPDNNKFKTIIKRGSKYNDPSVFSLIDDINDLNKINDFNDEILSGLLKASYNELKDGKTIYMEDELSTEEYAKQVYDNIPAYLYYGLDNGHYILGKVISKKIIKYKPSTKEEYKANYNSSNNLVKTFVYDNKMYEDYYKDFLYKVEVIVKEERNELAEEEFDTQIIPGNIKGERLFELMDDKKVNLANCIGNILTYYNSYNSLTRCDENDPAVHYREFNLFLTQLPVNSLPQSEILIKYINDTIKPWANKRLNSLIQVYIDDDNISKLTSLLRKRLTKNSGSVLIWYQSLLHLDNSYNNLNLSTKLINKSTRNNLITKAYNGSNELLYNNYDNIDYIDISNPDKMFYRNKDYNIGDTIYIISNKELKEYTTNIVRKEYIRIPSDDLSNLDLKDLDEKGIAAAIENNKIDVERLYINGVIPSWCKDADSVIIMKVM